MAIEYVDSTQLDSDLTSVANAIRAKSGGSSQLAFPAGFVSEIGNIPSGGKEVKLLASGTYTKTDNASKPYEVRIPVSFTGTPTQVYVYAPNPIEGKKQTIQWIRQFGLEQEAAANFARAFGASLYYTANGSTGAQYGGSLNFAANNTILNCGIVSYDYPDLDNTYNWYIWGYEE